MRCQILLFGKLRELAGTDSLLLDGSPGDTVAEARAQLIARLPQLEPFMDSAAWAVNLEYATLKTEMHEGDELAVIPPVSGGSDGH